MLDRLNNAAADLAGDLTPDWHHWCTSFIPVKPDEEEREHRWKIGSALLQPKTLREFVKLAADLYLKARREWVRLVIQDGPIDCAAVVATRRISEGLPFDHEDRSLTLSEWAAHTEIHKLALRRRLLSGIPLNKAIEMGPGRRTLLKQSLTRPPV
jgi:hypothetical protein